MKKIILISTLSLLGACAGTKQKPQSQETAPLSCPVISSDKAPKLLWTNTNVNMPESALFHEESKSIYVSNVVGSPIEKDKKGWISKLSLEGKTIKEKFIDKLNAPKGMRIISDRLYVTDIDELRSYNLKGVKLDRMTIKESKFLNDIAFYQDKVLVSDMLTGKVYRTGIKGSFDILLEGKNVESPNGLLVSGDTLYIAAWGNDIQSDFSTKIPGRLLEVNLKTLEVGSWTKMPMGNLDGLELDGENAVLVSDWVAGKVYHLKKSGECVTLLQGLKGTADIGFDQKTRTLYVPVMLENKVLAFQLENL